MVKPTISKQKNIPALNMLHTAIPKLYMSKPTGQGLSIADSNSTVSISNNLHKTQ